VSVSRSIFPITTAEDAMYFGGRQDGDQIGVIDGIRSTFGKTYAAEPDVLVEQLKEDAAIASADTLMLTIPSQLGVEFNLRVVESFAKLVAPSLGWEPTQA
jgi:alkanesulfonate monooxygenase SsuD/methylene tetrahydromethanopterin reductase-like flavin-dependent oxidoreductase (luciferase family)